MLVLIRITFVLLLFLTACQSDKGNTAVQKKTVNSKTGKKGISGIEAIKLAEEFVRQQGYTKLTLKKSEFHKIRFEEGEYASDTMQILKFRYNMLEPEGFAAKQHGNSWSVGFEYSSKENNIGRAVTMDSLAKNIIMQPGEVRIDWFYETK